jgi:hypothetical protein
VVAPVTTAEPIDTDTLPPTQYLILEVLAARWRLGHQAWTFPARVNRYLDALAGLGLVGWKHGIVERSALAWLTEAGRAVALSDRYEPPVAPRRMVALCGRCTRIIRRDTWGKWVDESGWRTCDGDRPHQPVGLTS